METPTEMRMSLRMAHPADDVEVHWRAGTVAARLTWPTEWIDDYYCAQVNLF